MSISIVLAILSQRAPYSAAVIRSSEFACRPTQRNRAGRHV